MHPERLFPYANCRCCFGGMQRGTGKASCPRCQEAGCVQQYGNWKRGEACPARARGRKKGR